MKFAIFGCVAASVLVIAASGAWADGQAVYNQNCGVGHANLSDADIKVAVEYIESKAQ